MIKTWYFSYSAFWLTGQWGKGFSPPPPLATQLNGTLFSPNSDGDLCSDAHQSQIIGEGCRCRPYSNYWGGYSQTIGGNIYPPSPLDFGTPDRIHRTLLCPTKVLPQQLVLYSVKLVTEMGEKTNDSTVALYKLMLRQMKFSLMYQMSMLPLNSNEYFQRLKSVVERQSPEKNFLLFVKCFEQFLLCKVVCISLL